MTTQFIPQGEAISIGMDSPIYTVSVGPTSGVGILLEGPANSLLLLESGEFLLLESEITEFTFDNLLLEAPADSALVLESGDTLLLE